jgi:hypothetical protein
MHASAKLVLALIAAAFAGSICAEEAMLKNESTFRSTAGNEAQTSPGAAATSTVGAAQSGNVGGGAASPIFNPKEFPLRKLNGPHTQAAPIDPPVARLPPTPVPATPPVVHQPRPAPAPAWPSKIDTITIKQGGR